MHSYMHSKRKRAQPPTTRGRVAPVRRCASRDEASRHKLRACATSKVRASQSARVAASGIGRQAVNRPSAGLAQTRISPNLIQNLPARAARENFQNLPALAQIFNNFSKFACTLEIRGEKIGKICLRRCQKFACKKFACASKEILAWANSLFTHGAPADRMASPRSP